MSPTPKMKKKKKKKGGGGNTEGACRLKIKATKMTIFFPEGSGFVESKLYC